MNGNKRNKMVSAWFKHDFNTVNNPKVQCLLADYHAAGYGVWWRLLELLGPADMHRIPDEKITYRAIAISLFEEVKFVKEIVELMVSEYKLFKIEDGYIYSAGFLERMEDFDIISEKNRANANARWDKHRKAEEALALEKETKTEPVEPEKKAEKKTKTELDTTDFDKFWNAYPNKVSKKPAQAAWKKIKVTPEVLEAMLRALEIQKGSSRWTKDKGQFVPNPATWLNAEKWEDETECNVKVKPIPKDFKIVEVAK